MDKRTAWVVMFSVCTLSHALIAAFGTTWFAILVSTAPLLGAVSSFAFIYAGGSGVTEASDARRTNR